MSQPILHKVIEDFNHLSLDEREYVIDVVKKQVIEAKRDAIAKRSKEAMANLKKGKIKTGTVKELYEDLESD